MRTKPYIPLILGITLVAGSLAASDRTANGVLAKPDQFNQQEVSLDVLFLRPVRWKSPIPEVAFFHALTYDKRAKSFGGGILLAAPESGRDALVRRYGVTHTGGRNPSTNSLRGTLRNTGEDRKRGIWFLDQTEGALTEELAKLRGKIEELEAGEGEDLSNWEAIESGGPRGAGGRPGGPRRGPQRQ